MVNYNIDDGNDSTDNNEDNDDGYRYKNLKITTYSTIDGDLEGTFSNDSEYGQSIALKMNNVVVVDGALYDRGDGTYKLFSWEALGLGEDDLDEDEELTEDMVSTRHSETYGQDTYSYKLVDSRIDEADEPGDTIPVGDIIMFESATENGPSSSAKNIARTLTDKGRDAVIDEDDQFSWLDDSIDLRSDLDGVHVRYFKVSKPGDEYDYDLPVFTHTELGERITIDRTSSSNDSETSGGNDSPASEDNPTPTEETNTPEGEDFHPDIQEFVDELSDMEINQEDQILRMLDSMVEADDGPFTDEMVMGKQDAIVEAIQG